MRQRESVKYGYCLYVTQKNNAMPISFDFYINEFRIINKDGNTVIGTGMKDVKYFMLNYMTYCAIKKNYWLQPYWYFGVRRSALQSKKRPYLYKNIGYNLVS